MRLRPRALVSVAVGVVLVAGILVMPRLLGTAPDEPAAAAGSSGTEERIAELRQQEKERDADLTRKLVTTAEQARGQIAPVLAELDHATGSEGSHSGDPAADVARWRQAVRVAAEPLEERPSAGTEVNLARAGLAGAVTATERAVEVYAESLEAEGPAAERLRSLAGAVRGDATAAWSVAATQLDVAGVAAGIGHVHVFLDGSDPHGG
ncbi:hypothetical protein BAY61_12165 [Prauserella marina]|nr:hypothetical protein BAY61_12165 [Prauserella marina]